MILAPSPASLLSRPGFEALLAAPENRGRLLELIEGEVYEKMPTEVHGVIALNIGSHVRSHVKARQLGRVGVEIRHGLPSDRHNDRIPDISFRAGLEGAPVAKGPVPQMPDLAIEISSPDDEYQDLRAKARYYLSHGSRLVWLVYPERQTVEVCTLSDEGEVLIQTLGIEDSLEGGAVLPDFRLALRAVFDLS